MSFLDLAQIKELKTGNVVRVTWSGGNGPHVYKVERTPHGAILACTDRLPPGYPGWLFDPIRDANAKVSINRVELLQADGQSTGGKS